MTEENFDSKQADIILIRHAQSVWNEQTRQIAKQMNKQLVWYQLCKDEEFNKKLTYNPKFIDSPLSKKGIAQCQQRQKQLQNINFDLILVSPQLRTLQTCQRLIGQRRIPIRVEPLLMQSIRYACDVSSETKIKKEMFSNYDFSQLQKLDDDWLLDILPKQQKEKAKRYYQKIEADNAEKRQLAMLQLMNSHTIYEKDCDIRKRIAELKQKLKKLQQQFPVIGIVSHWFTIKMIKAKGFDENGNLIPEEKDVLNCDPLYQSLDQLLKIK